MRSRGRCQAGQASLEYAVVLALVACAVVVGAAAARAGDVAGTVTRQMARAVCIVGAGDCDRDRMPCVLSSQRRRDAAHVNAFVVRLGGERIALVEERSDGTFVVTRTRAVEGGLDMGIGIDGGLRLGSAAILVGGEARAAILARHGQGETWTVGSRKEADALLATLALPHPHSGGRLHPVGRGRPAPGPPPPAETFGESGWSVTLAASGGVGVATGSLELTAGDVAGSRLDRATGHRTIYLKRTNALAAAVDLGKQVAGAGGTAGVEGKDVYSVEFDRDGRPLDLAIVQTGAFVGSADLPTRVQPVAGLLAVPTRLARVQETESHLDLTDGANLAAARDFVAQVTAPHAHLGALARVSAALERRMEEAGTVQARTYELTAKSYGGSGHLAGGLKIGGAFEHEDRTVRLLAAVSRGRDGQWTDRTDCVPAAA